MGIGCVISNNDPLIHIMCSVYMKNELSGLVLQENSSLMLQVNGFDKETTCPERSSAANGRMTRSCQAQLDKPQCLPNKFSCVELIFNNGGPAHSTPFAHVTR